MNEEPEPYGKSPAITDVWPPTTRVTTPRRASILAYLEAHGATHVNAMAAAMKMAPNALVSVLRRGVRDGYWQQVGPSMFAALPLHESPEAPH